jgi:hypothetical protein
MSQDQDQIFVQLVGESWKIYNEELHNRYVDDMLVGAVITAMVEDGFSLIDLTSDGMAHYLRFEHLSSKIRLVFRLTNRAENLLVAKVLGRHADVVIGYGEQVPDVGTLYQSLKTELKSTLMDAGEPGVITADADITSGYLYVQVPLILDLNRYFTGGLEIDYALLRQHLSATGQALQKYLRGRAQGH